MAGIVAGIAFCGLSMISGCQKDRSTAPAVKVEPPADTSAAVQPPEEKPAPSATAESPAQAAEPNAPEPPVSLALAFSVGQTATYRATTDARKSVEWMGPESGRPADFSDGYSGNHVEMTFEQRVEKVRDNGNALVEITIQGLKYRGVIQSRPVFEFDSTEPNDRDNPLAALIGKSYRLEMSPGGKVVELLDMESVRKAVKAGSPAYSVAAKLVSDEMIRDQHEVPPLSALKEGQARLGQRWSDVKSFAFGDMGAKGFERVYTLTQVEQGVGRTALVEMKAIPSAAMAEEMHKRQTTGLLPGLFDNTDKYDGRLDFDLDGGRIRRYMEDMRTEWIIADPAAMQDTTAVPRALKMGARRLHRLELVE
jgi:hypothetical protein